MTKKEVVIIGAGGHGRVIADIIREAGDSVLGFLDDSYGTSSNADILGTTDDYTDFSDKYFIIAIGNNEIRKKIAQKLSGVKFYTAVHPFSFISENATVEEGSVIMPGGVVNSGASIGRHSIVNSNSTVEHDCTVGAFSHISPGATLCGTVKTGENVWIGANASVKNNVTICDNVTVGMGSVVINSISREGTYVGVPCKKIN